MKQPATSSPHFTTTPNPAFDVVVAGATPAGISAAVAAARRGLRVALVDPLPVPGQMLSNGLSVFDTCLRSGVVGIMSDLVDRIARYHAEHYADQAPIRENRGAPRHGVADGLLFESHIVVKFLEEILAETPNLTYFRRHRIAGAVVDGKRCIGIRAEPIGGKGFDPRWAYIPPAPRSPEIMVLGSAVVDATYEGDIAASAGVPYRIGRDARIPEEPHNGIIYSDYHFGSESIRRGMLPETFLAGSTGADDPKVMAYNVRFIVKNYGRKEGPHRLAKPEGYDPTKFAIKKWHLADYAAIPNDKNYVNSDNDLSGALVSSYPDGSPEQRCLVLDALYHHARCYLYFLQTEGDEATWGLADDEFPLNDGWPYCPYIREARRIVGMATLTEADIHRWLPRASDNYFDGIPGDRSRPPLQRESIATNEYDIDSRPCDAPPPDRASCGEGGFLYSSIKAPFQVPYGCLVPQEIEGLIVPCALSTSHVAFSVVRMEPTWAQLGEAAGIAATLSIRRHRPFQEIDVASIQDELITAGCQLYYYIDLPPAHPAFGAIQRLSLCGSTRGFPDLTFRPERLLTRGQWVQMVASVLELNPSVTAHHFEDIPPHHPAFSAFETLYDHGAREGRLAIPFERHERIYCDSSLGYVFYARPDADITIAMSCKIIEEVVGYSMKEAIPSDLLTGNPAKRFLTRAEGARLLEEFLKWLTKAPASSLNGDTNLTLSNGKTASAIS